MLITIPNVLDAAQIAHARKMLVEADWVDGRVTAGHQSALAKDNMQLSEDHPVAQQLGDMILQALGQNPLFISAALPMKVFPPLFNSYSTGQKFGIHVDNAIRHVKGSSHRVRSDLSATLFLTPPEDYDGGDLVIEDTYGVHTVKLPLGHMVLYPSSSLHRVEPITRGRRVSSFFWKMPRKPGRDQMKVSKQKMAEHREQIIAAAAKRFRENGFDGISVADLMKEAGLTHGGFYGHFSSKEELVGEASKRALRETAEKWAKVIEEAPDKPLDALAKYYLSARHQAHPGTGCLFASLGSELGRQSRSVKEKVMQEQLILDLFSRIVPGKTAAAKRKRAIVAYAELIGGMILARSVPDAAFSEEILKTVSAALANSVHRDVG